MIDSKVTKRFAVNLPLIRKAVGWTAEELGNKVDVKRQTIMSIEKKEQITVPMYLAIRTQLETEIELHPEENEMVKVALDAFVDNPDKYGEKDKEEIKKEITLLSPALRVNENERKDVSNKWKALIALSVSAAVLSTIASIAIGAWRKK